MADDQEGAVDTFTVLEDFDIMLGSDHPDPAAEKPLRRTGDVEHLVAGRKVLLNVAEAQEHVEAGKLVRGSPDHAFKEA